MENSKEDRTIWTSNITHRIVTDLALPPDDAEKVMEILLSLSELEDDELDRALKRKPSIEDLRRQWFP